MGTQLLGEHVASIAFLKCVRTSAVKKIAREVFLLRVFSFGGLALKDGRASCEVWGIGRRSRRRADVWGVRAGFARALRRPCLCQRPDRAQKQGRVKMPGGRGLFRAFL